MSDPQRTQAMSATPSVDPNRTVMGQAPTIHATQTIKPVQCPVCKTFNPVGVMFCVECGLIFDRALDGDAFGAAAVLLPCFVDSAGREHPLRPGPNIIGRQGDVLIDDARVSRRHASAIFEDSITIEDLGSTNGTTVNGAALAVGEKRTLQTGDKVSLGGCELVLSLPGESAKTAMGLGGRTTNMDAPPRASTAVAWVVTSEGERLPLSERENSFGRRDDNDVVFPLPFVSGRHGTIEVSEAGVFITDVGSTNGTFLNDARIGPNQRVQLRPDDEIKLGEFAFRVEVEE
ncbi:MAG TPA: FHA domain-containing protein [Fimbriimonadaceae bacterium]|nr:FHA domain-containing protein [Fimbriimonadaceae bacterium]HRJ97874.1 FHA domain-containing protein [Fimbriimonadaceae bacterium]